MATKWTAGDSPVLCLDVSHEGLVASGAENGGFKVWNMQGSAIGHLNLEGDDVTCISFSHTCESIVYASHGEAISALDIRSLKEPIERFHVNEDEINCISINETDSHLAAADDSGSIKIIDLASKQVIRCLQKHSNICSCVTFRPHWPQSLLSCGLDMQVMLWNLQKIRPVWTVNLQDLTQEEEDNQQTAGCQLFNPPLAHFTTVASCGNVFACGAEDGKIRLFRARGTRFEFERQLCGHNLGVSQVHFLNSLSHPYWLISGGNDAKILLWDLSEQILTDDKRPSTSSRQKSKVGCTTKKARGCKGTAHSAKDNNKNKNDYVLPKLSIDHGDKVNWISGVDIKGSKRILIADQSCQISMYNLGDV
ncbi:WD repeat-containing protein 53 isoform X2 [Amblyraja radiata]|nr:WD repeat-containing protein 53 isoform X2 [Amblyraja radiata]XP_032887348.1 WD repeat-containing protein 53 isoform X2 [Amblyraja radiata]XP_032887349.1 WD repeat-containing protein 53 isoform X2 [Amblyraja radiata]XP_032887350.1 WD repeat-containing protein 53 isoform X2 [Amblyraja radiata]